MQVSTNMRQFHTVFSLQQCSIKNDCLCCLHICLFVLWLHISFLLSVLPIVNSFSCLSFFDVSFFVAILLFYSYAFYFCPFVSCLVFVCYCYPFLDFFVLTFCLSRHAWHLVVMVMAEERDCERQNEGRKCLSFRWDKKCKKIPSRSKPTYFFKLGTCKTHRNELCKTSLFHVHQVSV